jgi:fatty-acyl-CoA synthase
MKLAFTSMVCPDWRLDRIAATAARLGYQGIELRIDAGHDHRVETPLLPGERAEVRKVLQDANLTCCCIATGLQLLTEGVVDDADRRLELAASIGARGIRVFAGPVPEFLGRQEWTLRLSENLRHMAELAQGYEVEVWLQTHDALALGVDAAAIVRAANHPAAGILYDTLHPFRRGESIDATIAAVNGLVRHVHFRNGVRDPRRVIVKPLSEGDLPVDDAFTALVRMGYTGFLVGEWYYDQYGKDPDDSISRYAHEMDNLGFRHQQVLVHR